MRMISLWR